MARADRLHGKRIDHEGVLGIHRRIRGREERARDELEHVVGAVAEDEIRGRQRELAREDRLELEAAAVRVVMQLGERAADRLERARGRAQRVLVGGHLEDVRLGDPQLAGCFSDRLAGNVGRDRSNVLGREQLEVDAFSLSPGVPAAGDRIEK